MEERKKIVLLYHGLRVTFTTRTVAQLADEELRISDTFKPTGGGKEGEEKMQKTRSK